MEEFDRKIFAARLKELRGEMGIGQNRLAKELGLSNASISYWETGKQEPCASTLVKLASFFGVTIDYLLGLED